MLVGGPRVLALAAIPPDGRSKASALHPSLRYALSALTVRMPSLAERPARDRLAIARILLSVLRARMGLSAPELDETATSAIEQADWPGNIHQMRSVLGAALASHRREDKPMSGAEIEAQIDGLQSTLGEPTAETPSFQHWLDQAFSAGGFHMAELEHQIYQAAVARTEGNLSAAARLIGLTRAQLAYRLGA